MGTAVGPGDGVPEGVTERLAVGKAGNAEGVLCLGTLAGELVGSPRQASQ